MPACLPPANFWQSLARADYRSSTTTEALPSRPIPDCSPAMTSSSVSGTTPTTSMPSARTPANYMSSPSLRPASARQLVRRTRSTPRQTSSFNRSRSIAKQRTRMRLSLSGKAAPPYSVLYGGPGRGFVRIKRRVFGDAHHRENLLEVRRQAEGGNLLAVLVRLHQHLDHQRDAAGVDVIHLGKVQQHRLRLADRLISAQQCIVRAGRDVTAEAKHVHSPTVAICNLIDARLRFRLHLSRSPYPAGSPAARSCLVPCCPSPTRPHPPAPGSGTCPSPARLLRHAPCGRCPASTAPSRYLRHRREL